VFPMSSSNIDEFIAEGGPCDKVCICNEWKFQYKQSFVYRLTQVSEGVSKIEACQKIPSYFVEVVILPEASFSEKAVIKDGNCSSFDHMDKSPPLYERDKNVSDQASAHSLTESFLLKCFDLVH
jgi:hypothetical protein